MSLLDDLKKTIAKRAAEKAARDTASRFQRAVEGLAEDFLGAAESSLERARAEQGSREAMLEEAESQKWSLHEERMARKEAAKDELARLKAEREAAAGAADTDTDHRADTPKGPKKTL